MRVNSLDSADARASVRAARSAPTAALKDLAGRCGGLRVMLAHLAAARRGRCGNAIDAEAVATRPLLLGHPATPPAAVRAAAADLPRRSGARPQAQPAGRRAPSLTAERTGDASRCTQPSTTRCSRRQRPDGAARARCWTV